MTDKRKRDDWAAFEYACEMVNDLRVRLKTGAEGSGVALSADECDLLLRNLKTPAAPNNRPSSDGLKEAAINLYCTKLKRAGATPKNAVTDSAEHFGCSISTVRAAMRR